MEEQRGSQCRRYMAKRQVNGYSLPLNDIVEVPLGECFVVLLRLVNIRQVVGFRAQVVRYTRDQLVIALGG